MIRILLLSTLLFSAHRPENLKQTVPSTRAGKDYALFIAVKDYDQWPDLVNPIADVEKIANELTTNYGFESKNVVIARNKTRKEILAAINDCYKRAYDDDAQLLIFFSGHGYYDERKCKGYFIPRDAEKDDATGASYIDYFSLHSEITSIECRHILVAVDACFGGTFNAAMGCNKAKGDDDTDRPQDTKRDDRADFIRRTLAAESRIFFSAIGKETTSDNSRFAKRWLEALQNGYDYHGLLTAQDLRSRLRTGKEVFSTFGNIENDGAFVFVRNGTVTNEPSQAEKNTWATAQRRGDGSFYTDVYPDGYYAEEARKLKPTEPTPKQPNNTQPGNGTGSGTDNGNGTPPGSRPDNMIFIKGGTFQMGSNDGDSDEKPVHSVTVSDFYLSKYELTVAEFKTFIDAKNYQTDADKDDGSYIWTGSTWEKKKGVNWKCDVNGNIRSASDYNNPVIHISWNDAVAYCNWLSDKTGKTYRLPTEAEWEYAARGGNQSNSYKYAGSNDIGEVARYSSNAGSKTHPVGGKKANELGLFDMSGNVWEWCSDWYGTYPTAAQIDPTGPKNGSDRVRRGGSWYDDPQYCRVANRGNGVAPGYRFFNVGFRLARIR